MFDLLISLFNIITSIFNFILTSFMSLFSLIEIIPQYLSISTTLIEYLPTPIISVATLTISIYLLYLMLGR